MTYDQKCRLGEGVARVLRRAVEMAERFDRTEVVDALEVQRAADEVAALQRALAAAQPAPVRLRAVGGSR